jgi:hypothetical protein
MKIIKHFTLIAACWCQTWALAEIPEELCGNWQTPVKKLLRWDQPYDGAHLVISKDGRCPLVLGPPTYGATLVLGRSEKQDLYFYQIVDHGNVVEEGVLRYNRNAETLVFTIFETEVRMVREERLPENAG